VHSTSAAFQGGNYRGGLKRMHYITEEDPILIDGTNMTMEVGDKKINRKSTTTRRKNDVSKGQNSKKSSKKEPAMTMKEKKAAKREKKEEKKSLGLQKL
jgi:hypothetical protein